MRRLSIMFNPIIENILYTLIESTVGALHKSLYFLKIKYRIHKQENSKKISMVLFKVSSLSLENQQFGTSTYWHWINSNVKQVDMNIVIETSFTAKHLEFDRLFTDIKIKITMIKSVKTSLNQHNTIWKSNKKVDFTCFPFFDFRVDDTFDLLDLIEEALETADDGALDMLNWFYLSERRIRYFLYTLTRKDWWKKNESAQSQFSGVSSVVGGLLRTVSPLRTRQIQLNFIYHLYYLLLVAKWIELDMLLAF